MVTRATAKRRGAETQRWLAEYLQVNGWPYATDQGAGRNGNDVLGVPGLAIEVKARRDFNPKAWVDQAEAGGTGLPMCVLRPMGMANESMDAWPVVMRLADLVSLLRDAGFGDPR
jgi:hypothetical protein